MTESMEEMEMISCTEEPGMTDWKEEEETTPITLIWEMGMMSSMTMRQAVQKAGTIRSSSEKESDRRMCIWSGLEMIL